MLDDIDALLGHSLFRSTGLDITPRTLIATAEATKWPAAVTAAFNWALHSALLKHGIEIPVPQRDLNLRSWFGADVDEAIDAVVNGRLRRYAKREEKVSTPSVNDAVTEVQRQIAEEASRNAALGSDATSTGDAVSGTADTRTAAQHDTKEG